MRAYTDLFLSLRCLEVFDCVPEHDAGSGRIVDWMMDNQVHAELTHSHTRHAYSSTHSTHTQHTRAQRDVKCFRWDGGVWATVAATASAGVLFYVIGHAMLDVTLYAT